MHYSSLPLFFTSLLLFLSSLPFFSAQLCNPNDKKILLEIQTHFESSYQDLWDPKTDCCKDWSTWPAGIKCDATGRVIELSSTTISKEIPSAIGDLPFLKSLTLWGSDLTGSLPLSFAKLTNLEYLDLHINLAGPLPDFLGRLKRLRHIDLSNNQFTSIPASLAQLPNLQNLYLINNHLSGRIPDFLTQIKTLIELDLGGNRLSGQVPAGFANLPHLTLLSLNQNELTGPIPDSFGSFMNPNLRLELAVNKFAGPIPRSLGRANISELSLAANKFTGDASFLFGRDKTMLTSLSIGGNRLKFDFSNVELPRGLKELDISRNKIYGSLPKNLGQLPLRSIDVSYNKLCGKIPTGRRLKQFSPDKFAHNKCLCGAPLPPCKY